MLCLLVKDHPGGDNRVMNKDKDDRTVDPEREA